MSIRSNSVRWRLGAILTLFCFLGLATTSAHAQKCYAVGAGSTSNWSDGDNWSSKSGGDPAVDPCSGSGGQPYPNGPDTAEIENVFIVQDIASLSIGSVDVTGSSGLLILAEDMTVNGDVTVASSSRFNTYTVDGGGTPNGSGLLTITGTVTNNGTFAVDRESGGAGGIDLAGQFDNTATGTFDVNALAGGIPTATVGGLKTNGDTTVGGTGSLTSTGAVSIDPDGNNGTLNIGTGTLTVGGNFSISSSGSFTAGSSGGNDGTVVFNSPTASAATLSGVFNDTNSFFDVQINSGASINPVSLTGNDAPRIDGELFVEGRWGSTSGEESDLIFQGPKFEIDNNGDFFANNVTFNNKGTTTVQGTIFSDVLVTNTTEIELLNAFTINGLLDVNGSDIVDLKSGTLTLNGNVRVAGQIEASNGGVSFNGGVDQTVTGEPVTGSLTLGDVTVFNNAGNTKVIFSSVSPEVIVNDLAIQSGTEIETGRPFEVKGNFTNTGGEFNFKSDATVRKLSFTGSGSNRQVINSSSEIQLEVLEIASTRNSLQTDPDVRVMSGSAVSVSEQLIMTSGVFDTNADLTLEPGGRVIYNSSDSDTDGTLDSFIGDDTGATDFKSEIILRGASSYFFIAPSTSTTYQEFLMEEATGLNSLWIQGPANSDVPIASFANTNLFFYDESVTTGNLDVGWTAVGDVNSSIPQGEGVLVYAFADDKDGTIGFPKTIDAVGTPDFSPTIDLPITFNSSGTLADDGWNFVGNPYLNVLDWDNIDGDATNTTNIGGSVYVWNPDQGSNGGYESYNGSGTTGSEFTEEGYIAPLQAFFVKATGSSPQLTVDIDAHQLGQSTPSVDPFSAKLNRSDAGPCDPVTG